MDKFKLAPRIYNIFPRLLGPLPEWTHHLDRIKKMHFNWVYSNPLSYTGFSGSLYSIKDYFKLNPLFAPKDSEDPHSWDPLQDFIGECHSRDIHFMTDLVINHVAIDSGLVQEKPDWFEKKWALVDKTHNIVLKFYEGEEKPSEDVPEDDNMVIEYRIVNPYAIDPADSRKITIWGDLAELNFDDPSNEAELIEYWKKYLKFCIDLGIDGFRCDAAYQVPSEVWNTLITFAKKFNRDIIFLAETLGCTINQCEMLTDAGFDYINDSNKWWDFTAPWLIEQYNQFREFAPSVGFPESHDTNRLSQESGGRKDVQIFRYFFAAFFSTGIVMPIGYEFGFKRKLHVVQTEPSYWEDPVFDISEEIEKINEFKMKYRTLNENGEIIHQPYPDPNVLVLQKNSLDETQKFLLLYNKDWTHPHEIYIPDLNKYLDLNRAIFRVSHQHQPIVYSDTNFRKILEPNEFVVFMQ